MTALMGIDTRLKLARLLFITDARRAEDDLAGLVTDALSGGADIVELRDDRLRATDQLDALRAIRRVAQEEQGLVAVWSDADVAGEFSADLLHLPAGTPAREARRRLHEWALVGCTADTPAEVDAALADDDVAFLIVSTDPEAIRHAAERAPQTDPGSKPWFAAGGITLEGLDDLVASGVRRIAVTRAIARAHDASKATAALVDRLRRAWNEDDAMERVTMSAFGRGYGKVTDGVTFRSSGARGSGAHRAGPPGGLTMPEPPEGSVE